MNLGTLFFKVGKLLLYMDSMIKLTENMETLTHGNTVLKFLIIYPLELLLIVIYHPYVRQSILCSWWTQP